MNFKIAVSYKNLNHNRQHHLEHPDRLKVPPKPDEKYQHSLREFLSTDVGINYWPVNNNFIHVLETLAKTPVGIVSRGPCLGDKEDRA